MACDTAKSSLLVNFAFVRSIHSLYAFASATTSLVLFVDKVQVVLMRLLLSDLSLNLLLEFLQLTDLAFAYLGHIQLFDLTLVNRHFLFVLDSHLFLFYFFLVLINQKAFIINRCTLSSLFETYDILKTVIAVVRVWHFLGGFCLCDNCINLLIKFALMLFQRKFLFFTFALNLGLRVVLLLFILPVMLLKHFFKRTRRDLVHETSFDLELLFLFSKI